MQKLTPEKVADYSFQIVVVNSMDYIYYLHEPDENEYLFMSVYPYRGKFFNAFYCKGSYFWQNCKQAE